MFDFLTRLFSKKPAEPEPQPMDILRKTGSFPFQKAGSSPTSRRGSAAEEIQEAKRNTVDDEPEFEIQGALIEDGGPGKNVFTRETYTGSNDRRAPDRRDRRLSVLDEAEEDLSEGGGIDPYNTGRFDRSRSWDKQFKK